MKLAAGAKKPGYHVRVVDRVFAILEELADGSAKFGDVALAEKLGGRAGPSSWRGLKQGATSDSFAWNRPPRQEMELARSQDQMKMAAGGILNQTSESKRETRNPG